MPQAVIYIRVSTEEQVGDNHHSLDAQKSICEKIAKEKGCDVVRVFEDAGKSASSMQRPALLEMLSLLKADNAIKYLFVQDTDRLARNTLDHLTIRAILKKKKIILISASQPGIDDSVEGTVMDTVVAAINQFQSDITARKTLKGMEQKAREGWLPGKAPLGYKNMLSESGKNIVVFDDEVAPLIRKAFQLYATGGYSIAYLRDFLHDSGLRSKTGKKLQYSRLNGILQNRFYIGELHWGGIALDKAGHQPLVERAIFDAVQRVMADHNHHANRRRKHDFLLRGVVFCSVCTKRLVAEKHERKNIAYYHCSNRGYCPGKAYVSTDFLEDDVLHLFRAVQFSKSFTDKVALHVNRLYESKKQKIDIEKRRLYQLRSSFERKRALLEEKLLNGVVDDSEFDRMRSIIRNDLAHIQEELDKVEAFRDSAMETIKNILSLSSNVAEAYRKAPPELKKRYLALFWERFEVDGKDIVKAVPTKIFQVLLNQAAIILDAKKPALVERASGQTGGRHPRKQAIATSGQLVTSWGG